MNLHLRKMGRINTLVVNDKSSSSPSEREIFLSFCRHGSLSGAAEELSVYASTVSRSIGNLEKKLNVSLVKKIGNKLFLTEIGEKYYENINKSFSDIISYEKKIGEYAFDEITVITSDFFLDAWVSNCISEFMKENKAVRVKVFSDDTLTRNNPTDNVIFVGFARNNKSAENMILKNITKTSVGFYTTTKNKSISREKTYSISEIMDMKTIELDTKKHKYLTTHSGKRSYDFHNSFIVVDSLAMCLEQGVRFNCVFVSCESVSKNAVEEGVIYKLKTSEELDPIYIDVIYTENLKKNPKIQEFINKIHTVGMQFYNGGGNFQ